MRSKQFFKGFQTGMKEFGIGVSVIVNSLLLSIVYVAGVGFTSLFAKLVGKRFLETKKKKDTYWSDLDLKKKPLEEYYRQF